jgi:hypothetical protein
MNHLDSPDSPKTDDLPVRSLPTVSSAPTTSQRATETIEEVATVLRDLFTRVPETVTRVVDRALTVGETTVLVRLSDRASTAVETLVSAGLFGSRTEAASFLIDAGCQAQVPLFGKIEGKLSEIEKLRNELRDSLTADLSNHPKES